MTYGMKDGNVEFKGWLRVGLAGSMKSVPAVDSNNDLGALEEGSIIPWFDKVQAQDRQAEHNYYYLVQHPIHKYYGFAYGFRLTEFKPKMRGYLEVIQSAKLRTLPQEDMTAELDEVYEGWMLAWFETKTHVFSGRKYYLVEHPERKIMGWIWSSFVRRTIQYEEEDEGTRTVIA